MQHLRPNQRRRHLRPKPIKRTRRRVGIGGLVGLLLVMLAGLGLATSGKGVHAWHLPGASNTDKTCTAQAQFLGLDSIYADAGTKWIEFKLEGTSLNNGTHSDGFLSVTISNLTSTTFDWSSSVGIDAVVVKDGAEGANLYVYDGLSASTHGSTDLGAGFVRDVEETSDTGLKVPGTLAISHISFCYDVNLVVAKTAETTFTRTFEWDIDKSVTPDEWDLFTGDTGTSEYTVEITKTGFTDSEWAVSGTITIINPHPSASATITGVSDTVTGGIDAAVECGVTFPHLLAAGGTLECTYSADLPDDTSRVNTATVTTSGAIGGGTATADVTFGDPTTVVDDEVNVEDTVEGDLGSFTDSDTVTYSRTFSCDDDEGEHGNTATIVETGQSDDASVTVNCWHLSVSKDASTSFTRTWEWTIIKSADETELLLAEGQLFEVNYEVTVDASATDSAHAVSGKITITNPAPIDADLTGVADVVSPDIAASVNCPSLMVPAEDELECTYSADLPDATTRTNTATATQQNYDYDSEGVATASGTTDYSGTAPVDFSDATMTEIDECVDVEDTNVGTLGTVCAGDAPETFEYSLWFGAHPDADVVLECGENTHRNVASFETNDTATTGEDDETVTAVVACANGCTLTPGYWKTHSQYGPAPYDNTWAEIGEDTPFFLSDKTYYEVLWTPPTGGNAYYILAHAYIATELNFLNGASAPQEVLDAFDAATALFETYTPEQIAAAKGKAGNELRSQFISLAKILDDYNNGLTGPGHCSEDGNSG